MKCPSWTPAVFATYLLLALFSTGCAANHTTVTPPAGEAGKFLGTWVTNTITIDGETYTIEDLGVNGAITLSISADGTAYISAIGGSQTAADAYKISGDTLTIIDAADGTTMPFRFSNDILVLDCNDVSWPDGSEFEGTKGVFEFIRISTPGDSNPDNLIGQWKGHDIQLDNMEEPELLSSFDMNSSLTVEEDLTGEFAWSSPDDNKVCFIRLKPSDKTTNYLMLDASDNSQIGSISYINNSGKEWLLLTIFITDGHMQLSFVK